MQSKDEEEEFVPGDVEWKPRRDEEEAEEEEEDEEAIARRREARRLRMQSLRKGEGEDEVQEGAVGMAIGVAHGWRGA